MILRHARDLGRLNLVIFDDRTFTIEHVESWVSGSVTVAVFCSDTGERTSWVLDSEDLVEVAPSHA